MTVHVTQAAEGLPRRAFTTRDIERLSVRVHRDPTPTGSHTVIDHGRDTPVSALHVAELSLQLDAYVPR